MGGRKSVRKGFFLLWAASRDYCTFSLSASCRFFPLVFIYFLSFGLLIALSLKTDSSKEFVPVFCFSPAREGKLTKHKQLVTELKQIFQVTVLYLSIYFSQNFILFTSCNSFKYHFIYSFQCTSRMVDIATKRKERTRWKQTET